MRLVLIALLLSACRVDSPDPKDTGTPDTGDTADTDTATDTDTDTAVGEDVDGDGESAATDCDDTDATVFTGAPEVCNDRDDDCDGSIDELAIDAGRWYDDDDGDGYGVETIVACDPPDGASAEGGDCDDGDPYVSPGAAEVCGGGDENCDGAIDADPVDEATWFEDADGDGYGDPVSSTVACDAPYGFVANADDCDPADPAVNPAAVELCDPAEIDEDCDGGADDFDAGGALGTITTYTDADGDGVGDAAAPLTACDPVTGSALEAGDCDDANSTVFPGADEVCADRIDQDCDGVDAECPVE